MVKRSRQEVFASILRSVAGNKDGSKFTRMIYRSFLSHTQMSRHLKGLIRAGLLVNEPDLARYRITDKGLRFLELLEKMDDLINL